mgnify:CR=1 FL=1
MNVCVLWAVQKKESQVTWGGVVSINATSFVFTASSKTIKMWTSSQVKLGSVKLDAVGHAPSVWGFHNIKRRCKSRVTKTEIVRHFQNAYKKAQFIRVQSTCNNDYLFESKFGRLPFSSGSRFFPMTTVESSTCTYTYKNLPCLGGDCKVNGTSALVKTRNSYWTCQNCSKSNVLSVLASTCKIADDNKAPSATVKKRFVANGGTIKYRSASTQHVASGM